MRTIADLITDWIEAKPNRSAAGLSRLTGVPKSTISSVMRGRKPSLDVTLRLCTVIHGKEMLLIANEKFPMLGVLIEILQTRD